MIAAWTKKLCRYRIIVFFFNFLSPIEQLPCPQSTAHKPASRTGEAGAGEYLTVCRSPILSVIDHAPVPPDAGSQPVDSILSAVRDWSTASPLASSISRHRPNGKTDQHVGQRLLFVGQPEQRSSLERRLLSDFGHYIGMLARMLYSFGPPHIQLLKNCVANIERSTVKCPAGSVLHRNRG